jgi:hypothetical protein
VLKRKNQGNYRTFFCCFFLGFEKLGHYADKNALNNIFETGAKAAGFGNSTGRKYLIMQDLV